MSDGIAVVVPTIRPEKFEEWKSAWYHLLVRHGAYLVTVWDGEDQHVDIVQCKSSGNVPILTGQLSYDYLGSKSYLIQKYSPACRNLGFIAAAENVPYLKYVITLDDDVLPDGDTIEDHINALQQLVPISWLSPIDQERSEVGYMRGFPYGVREEAPVMLSHGVWKNIPDLDAPTQLILGESPEVHFYRGPIPKGIFTPISGMNLAFRVEAMPYLYWAPVKNLPGAERFDDIWMGLHATKFFESFGWAIVTGYASVIHTRASNVFRNMVQESVGLEINETLWQHDLDKPENPEHDKFFKFYKQMREDWKHLILDRI